MIELEHWSVTIPLTSGQLHRLTNALAGRGTRSGIRPLATSGEHVYLTGSPETLTVEAADSGVVIPAGPRRGMAKALRAYEESLKAA